MRNLKSKLLGGLSMIIVCMTVFAGNAAASEDLKLNPDALTKVKDEVYGRYDFDGYWLPSNELFLGIGTEGCTFGELFDCVQGYGLECEWVNGTKDTMGFKTSNFYIGTVDWEMVMEIPEPAKLQDILSGGSDEELKTYYQTNEWLQYQKACEEKLKSVRIYPNTQIEAAFWQTIFENDFGFMEMSLGSYEPTEKEVSLAETQAIIDKVNFSNNISNIKPHGEKNGWLFEDEAWRYYENNIPITSSWKDIEGKRYYFKDDSSMAHSGLFEIDGNIYSFSVDGPVDLGWHIQNPGDGDHWYYFRNDSECFGAAMVGFRNSIEGDFFQYFFWTNGYTDQNGNSHPTGSLAIGNDSSDQWILKDGIPVYVADKDGHLYTNTEKQFNGTEYILDNHGYASLKNPMIKPYGFNNKNYMGNSYSDYYVVSGFDPRYVIKQTITGNNGNCTATSDFLVGKITGQLDGNTEYYEVQNTLWGSDGANWTYTQIFRGKSIGWDANRKLNEIHMQIERGNPVIVRCSDHSVTAIGIRKNANISSIQESDILVVDSSTEGGRILNLYELRTENPSYKFNEENAQWWELRIPKSINGNYVDSTPLTQ